MKLEQLSRLPEFIEEDPNYFNLDCCDYKCLGVSTQFIYLTVPDIEIYREDIDDVSILLKSISTYFSFVKLSTGESFGIYVIGEYFFQHERARITIPRGYLTQRIKDKIYHAKTCFLFANINIKELEHE